MRRRAVAGAAKRRPGRDPDAQTPEAPPEPVTDPAEQLRELSELREQGILSEEEFAAEKKKLLGL
jgi:hypothetical protein